jgi:uncharacterized membrane protein (DUF4010 family)
MVADGMEEQVGGAVTALLLGLLLGLERERSQEPEERFAGIRTFPILALAGYVAGVLGGLAPGHDGPSSPLALPVVLLGVSALAVVAYLRAPSTHHGTTTEALVVATPLLGALVAAERPLLAAALTVMVALLLALKAPLHRLAGTVTEAEILSILKFGIVAVVLVPLLPTTPIGPYAAVVPRHVGLVVLVISGVSLGGYLLVRLLGGRSGWAVAGLLGGLVSSTAVTLSFSSKVKSLPELARPLCGGILLASTLLYARAFVLVFLFDRTLAFHLLPHLALLLALGAAFALVELRAPAAADARGELGLGNPVELGRAFGLGLFFALILVAARAAQEELGTAGLLGAGALGGLLEPLEHPWCLQLGKQVGQPLSHRRACLPHAHSSA